MILSLYIWQILKQQPPLSPTLPLRHHLNTALTPMMTMMKKTMLTMKTMMTMMMIMMMAMKTMILMMKTKENWHRAEVDEVDEGGYSIMTVLELELENITHDGRRGFIELV